MTEQTEIIPIPCRICKQPVPVVLPEESCEYRGTLERVARLTVTHNTCFDQNQARIKAASLLLAENAKLTSWKSFCPVEFQKEIDWRKSGANRTNLNKVLSWTFGEKGLLVRGGNGKCKTRFMWRLLEREWNMGRTIIAHAHTHFRELVSSLASSDQVRLISFVNSLNKAQILFIDDLGKGRSTPASEEVFFDVLDCRMRNCKPTLFTMDISVEALHAQFSSEYGLALIRRIIERCDEIEF